MFSDLREISGDGEFVSYFLSLYEDIKVDNVNFLLGLSIECEKSTAIEIIEGCARIRELYLNMPANTSVKDLDKTNFIYDESLIETPINIGLKIIDNANNITFNHSFDLLLPI